MFPSPESELSCRPMSEIMPALIFFKLRYDSAIETFNVTVRPLMARVRQQAPWLPDCDPIDIFINEAWRELLFGKKFGERLHRSALETMMHQLMPMGEEIMRGRMAIAWVARLRPAAASSQADLACFLDVPPVSRADENALIGAFCEYFYCRRAALPANFALASLRHDGGKSRASAHDALTQATLRTGMPVDQALTAILKDAHHLISRPWRAGDLAAGWASTQPPWTGRCVAVGAPVPLKLSFCSFMWYANRTLPANRDRSRPLCVPPYRPARSAFGLPGLRAPAGSLDDPDLAPHAGQQAPAVDMAAALQREHARAHDHAHDGKHGPGPRTYAPRAGEDIREDDFVYARIHSFRGRAVVNQLRREIQETAIRAIRAAGDGLVLCHLKGKAQLSDRILVLDQHDTFPGLFDPILGFIRLDLGRGANRFFFVLMTLAARYQSESVCFYAARFD